MRPRISTTEELLAPKKPLPATMFIKTLLCHDHTVLAISGDAPVPKYIAFDNEDASLFSSQKISFKHAKNEEALLRCLYRDHGDLIEAKIDEPPGVEKTTSTRSAKRGAGAHLHKRKVIREAHNKGKPNKLDSVQVDGVSHKSTWAAWQALKIGGTPRSSPCQTFRAQLKDPSNRGQLSYTDKTTGKTYLFRLIPYDPAL